MRPATSDVYLDVTTNCRGLSEALSVVSRINAASKRQIIALYNSSLDKTVYL